MMQISGVCDSCGQCCGCETAPTVDTNVVGDLTQIATGNGARRYRAWARRISDLAWRDALVPLQSLEGKGVELERIENRAEALECARLWFTRALKNDQGAPIRIRITKDLRFKLGTMKQFSA